MKAGLQLKLGQSLTLTPQLRQAIRLLQLSALELELEITQALESNPLLEREDEQQDEDDWSADEAAEADDDGEETPAEAEIAPDLGVHDESRYDWDDVPVSAARADGEEREAVEGSAESDLIEHLLWQLNLTPMSERDRRIGLAVIEAIDEDGYLHESTESLAAALRPEIDADAAEIEALRHRIQRFDPLGVASRTLSECLCVQLAALPEDSPGRTLALRIAAEELEALARLGIERLARQIGEDVTAVDAAVALLRRQSPKPGAPYASRRIEYITPDAYAFRHNGRWEVSLGSGSTPRLGINRHYESLIGSVSRGDASYLRGQLQEARWLIRSLETRADTLLRVARAIVGRQSAFLDHGPEAMRPLVLREIAEEVELHESTISRVTTRKYLHTPRGTFELKHFFSSSLPTVDGGAASSTAIQAMIRRLVDAENPRRPLSDARLTAELKTQGVTVARRTVAKYREAMNIPSSNERQRLA